MPDPAAPAPPPRPRPPAPCPICARPVLVRDNRPFCSARCRQVDLGRWITGAYAIPGEPVSEDAPRPGEASSEDDQGGGGGA